jgi:xylose isomerase
MISDDLQARWWKLEEKLLERFGKKPDMESILFLIGVQEVGGVGHSFTKEQKQDLMHVAVCSILIPGGYYELEGWDEDNWPHFKQTKELPPMEFMQQENFMKDHVLFYFSQNEF